MSFKKINKVLLILNMIFQIFGMLVFIVGLSIESNRYDVKFIDTILSYYKIFIIIFGFVVAALGLIGYVAATREIMCLLRVYQIIQAKIACVALVLAILILIKMENFLSDVLREVFDNYHLFRTELDALQQRLHCCGYDGPSYWKGRIHPSCMSRFSTVYQNSCIDVLWEIFRDYFVVGPVALLVVAILQVVSCLLVRKILGELLSGRNVISVS